MPDRIILNPHFVRQSLSACMVVLALLVQDATLFAQKPNLPPVRAGDQVEYQWLGSWSPAEVVEYYETGHAALRYTFAGSEKTTRYALSDIRFPNDEGHWMYWSDASGKFRIAARLISRNETHVTLRKEDGSDVQVPIESLNKALQAELGKLAKAVKKLHDESPLRIGDEIEVRRHWTWYPATVLKILPAGALVAYRDGTKTLEQEFKHDDMRYANGEGPWREWSDSTGKHKVFARYITHDDTHVELLKEDKKTVQFERTKLSTKIQTELNNATQYTRRPVEVEFQLAGKEGNPTSTWMSFGPGISEFSPGQIDAGSSPAPQFEEGGFEFPIGKASVVSLVEPIGGDQHWIAIGVHEAGYDATTPTTLHWASISERKATRGPSFLPDEVILAYSASQQRLITAEVRGAWSTPVRFCSYRLTPGGKVAKPELKWSVPKASFATASASTRVAFLDDNRVLIGYGSAVALWNLNDRRMEYVIPSSNNTMNLSPNAKYFATNQFSRSVIVETATGTPVARHNGMGFLAFSRDGKYLISATSIGLTAQSLSSSGKSVFLGNRSWSNAKLPGDFSLVADGWMSNGSGLWNTSRRLLAWTYIADSKDLSLIYSSAMGGKLLAVGTRGKKESTSVLLGVAKIPNEAAIKTLDSYTDEEIYVLRPGAKVRVDSSVQDRRMIDGIIRAAAAAGWQIDPSSDIVITASAQLGTAVTKTYERTAGFGRSGGDYRETVTVQPWIQLVEVSQGVRRLWSDARGGVPGMVMVKENASIQEELNRASEPAYDLFDSFSFPERVIAPKFENGLGSSRITPNGLVDQLAEQDKR
jgi:SLA1 homology domain 1, SHD1/Agenet domain